MCASMWRGVQQEERIYYRFIAERIGTRTPVQGHAAAFVSVCAFVSAHKDIENEDDGGLTGTCIECGYSCA
jgi:hypothetical protein